MSPKLVLRKNTPTGPKRSHEYLVDTTVTQELKPRSSVHVSKQHPFNQFNISPSVYRIMVNLCLYLLIFSNLIQAISLVERQTRVRNNPGHHHHQNCKNYVPECVQYSTKCTYSFSAGRKNYVPECVKHSTKCTCFLSAGSILRFTAKSNSMNDEQATFDFAHKFDIDAINKQVVCIDRQLKCIQNQVHLLSSFERQGSQGSSSTELHPSSPQVHDFDSLHLSSFERQGSQGSSSTEPHPSSPQVHDFDSPYTLCEQRIECIFKLLPYFSTMVVVRDADALHATYSRYAFPNLNGMTPELKTEHRNLCLKERLTKPFALPKIASIDDGTTLLEVDSHYAVERNLKNSATNLGLGPAFNIRRNGGEVAEAQLALIAHGQLPLVLAGDAAAPPAPAVPALVAAVDMFDVGERFTQAELESHSYWCNTNDNAAYATSNMLLRDIIINNLKPDLRRKIDVQLESIALDRQGGALTLFLVRQAVVRASSKHTESIIKGLKNLKITDFSGENIDEVVRVSRNNLAVLTSANAVPGSINKILLKMFQTSSNTDFNKVFETWQIGTVVQNLNPTREDIFDKALEVYATLTDERTWLKVKKKKGASFAAVTEQGSDDASDADTDAEDGDTPKKPRRRKKKTPTSTPSETAAQATSGGAGSGGGANAPPQERVRTFSMRASLTRAMYVHPRRTSSIFLVTSPSSPIILRFSCGGAGPVDPVVACGRSTLHRLVPIAVTVNEAVPQLVIVLPRMHRLLPLPVVVTVFASTKPWEPPS